MAELVGEGFVINEAYLVYFSDFFLLKKRADIQHLIISGSNGPFRIIKKSKLMTI